MNLHKSFLCLIISTLVACQQHKPNHSDSQASPRVEQSASSLKHRWHLVSFMNYSPKALHKASLDLTGSPNANLYAGCNQIRFSVKTMYRQVVLGDMMSTRMACMNNTLEKDLTQALQGVMTYQLSENTLTLTSEKGQKIVLSR